MTSGRQGGDEAGATYNAIMPDHFHGIVYITCDGAADLGAVVSFAPSAIVSLLPRLAARTLRVRYLTASLWFSSPTL